MKTPTFRIKCNRLLEGLIRLCMLTGITFVVTACYGPYVPPEIYDSQSPEYKERLALQQRLEQMAQESNEQGE